MPKIPMPWGGGRRHKTRTKRSPGKVGKEAREVKRKSKQIVAEGLKRNEKDRRGWKRRRGEGDR